MKLSEMPKPSKALYDALLQWRKRHAIEVLGENAVYQYGARLFMPDRLVKQVVACAEAGNLRSVADMDREELQWYDWGEKYKPSLIELVLEHYPILPSEASDQPTPPFVPPPPPPSASLTEDLTAKMDMLHVSTSNHECSGSSMGGPMKY